VAHRIDRVRGVSLLVAGLLATGLALDGSPALAQAPAAAPAPVAVADGVTLLADRLEEVGNVVIATGNVELTRGAQRLLADRLELDRQTGDTVAQGNVIFYDGDDRIAASRIDYNVRTGSGVVYDGEAQAAPYYRLSGERMERLDESRYAVRRGIFTTCEDDPPTWSFRFGEAHADLESWLWGTDASFWIGGIPVIPFIPYFAAAIRRERQTGFLFPRVGISSSRGVSTEIPFFWAISDSQDLTVAPLVFSQRGYGGAYDYRYILSALNRGRATGFLLYEGLRDEPKSEVDSRWRASGSLLHTWEVNPTLRFLADLNGVSDDEVLREYGDRLQERRAQRVEQNVAVTKTWPAWSAMVSAFSYQDLTTTRPVELRRVPELRVDGMRQPVPGIPGLLYELESSATKFIRDVGSEGHRADFHPRLAYPIPIAGTVAVTPFVGGRLTAYDRTVTGRRLVDGLVVENTDENSQLRRLAEAGVDLDARAARLYSFNRWGIDNVMHVIEPRVNYTWIAGKDLVRYGDDGDLVLTRLPQWDFIDAIPETSRFTYMVTNRVFARTATREGFETVRWEAARFTLGHSYELRNHDRPVGEIFGELILNPNDRLSFRGEAFYSPYEGFQTGITDVTVRFPRGHVFVGSRFSDPDDVQYLQAGTGVEVTRVVSGRVSADYDVRTNTLVEGRVGLELRWQCWAFTFEYVRRNRDEDELRFALNLLGLGGPIGTHLGLGGLGAGSGTRAR
jgi:LPS-assembly protein